MKHQINSLLACSLTFGALLTGCGSSEPVTGKQTGPQVTRDANWLASVEVHNPSTFNRPDESIYFSYYDLGLAANFNQSLSFSRGEKVVPSQAVDSDFDGKIDGVKVLASMMAGEKFQLDAFITEQPHSLGNKRTQAEIAAKQGGQWQQHARYPDSDFKEYVGGQFQNVETITPPKSYTDHSYYLKYEGPGIESDQVGYRVYLDWRNGFDIFGKLTPKPVLQDIGQDGYDSYHQPQPWGMDILKVGSSLGSGGFGLWHNGALERITKTDSRGVSIGANGHIYSAFSIAYNGWQSAAGKQDLQAHISMDAGSHLANVTLDLQKPVKTMAAGIVKHEGTELIIGDLDITGVAYTYIASWGKQALDGNYLGMAVFFQKDLLDKVTEDKNNYLAILKPKGKRIPYNKETQQLDYHFAALWQPQSGIATKAEFESYLVKQAQKLTLKPRLRLTTRLNQAVKKRVTDAEQALSWAIKLADSELQRKGYTFEYDGWDINRRRPPKFDYDITGFYPHTLSRLADITGDKKYHQALFRVTDSFINEDGTIKRYKKSDYNIDKIAPGRAVLKLYELTGEEKYKKAAGHLRAQLHDHPKTTEGAFWHKQKYTSQLWLDGVYMGMPFLTEYSNRFEDGHSLEEVIKEFELTYQYLRDVKTGNYYHGWDELKQQPWADAQTGLSPEFWARGMGWLAMALVDVLAMIDSSEVELRAPLIKMSQDLAKTLAQEQDETGTWWQVIDKPNQVANYREASASAMFTYFLASAIESQVISDEYLPMTQKAFQGLIDEFVLVHQNGEISITNLCFVAGLGFGRDGSYDYYMSEPLINNDAKATVPFMLASMAMYELLKAGE